MTEESPDSRPRLRLTARQREVAALIARGLTNRQIANELVLTPGTVANHIAQMLGRIGADSRAQIAAWAIEYGLSPTQDRLLTLLERLLDVETRTLESALGSAAALLRDALEADRTYVFVHDPAADCLVLRASSHSGSHSTAVSPPNVPVAHGGWIVETFLSGEVHRL